MTSCRVKKLSIAPCAQKSWRVILQISFQGGWSRRHVEPESLQDTIAVSSTAIGFCVMPQRHTSQIASRIKLMLYMTPFPRHSLFLEDICGSVFTYYLSPEEEK